MMKTTGTRIKTAAGLLFFLLLLVCTAAAADVAIDENNFPDEAFRTLVRSYDTNGDGSLSETEIGKVTQMNAAWELDAETCRYFRENVKNLQGICFFTSLKELYVTNTSLVSLDLSMNPKLEIVHCYSNELTSLNVRNCSLLTELNCDSNPLTELDLSGNRKLRTLVCGNVKLKSLDLSNNPELTKVLCEQWCYGYNDLSEINIRNCGLLLDLVLKSRFGDIRTDLFPNQVAYCHWMHGWFTDDNSDEKLDNAKDRALLVSGSTKVITDAGTFYGRNCKEGNAIIGYGKCGENLIWNLDDQGILTISGTGDMTDAPWAANEVKQVVIGEGVTGIQDSAFKDCRNLEEVSIPETVTKIGDLAFGNCVSLKSICIPSGVTELRQYDYEDGAFFGCVNLTEILVAKDNPAYCSVDGILYSKQKKELCICPEGKTGNCMIPDGVTEIRPCAFRRCRKLDSVTISGSVKSVGYLAFYKCSGLTAINIPASVTDIDGDYDLFAGCENLAEITADPENPAYRSVEGVLFNKGMDELLVCPEGKSGSFVIPDGVKDIVGGINSYDHGAFEGCGKLTAVTIPGSVTYIDWWVFAGCSSLKDLTIREGVEYIGGGAFSGCDSLTHVTIPKSVKRIENGAFSNCNNLAEITMPDSLEGIGADYMFGGGVFSGCSSLTSVTIPAGVTTVAYETFSGCINLTSVTIPAGVTDISYSAFYNCDRLSDVYYGGTEEQWNRIGIEAEGNAPLLGATVHFKTQDDQQDNQPGDSQDPGPEGGLPGDVNSDGVVDGRDTVRLMKFLAEEIDPETEQVYEIEPDNADVTGDGEIDAKDLLRLMKYLGGEKVTLEYGKVSRGS